MAVWLSAFGSGGRERGRRRGPGCLLFATALGPVPPKMHSPSDLKTSQFCLYFVSPWGSRLPGCARKQCWVCISQRGCQPNALQENTANHPLPAPLHLAASPGSGKSVCLAPGGRGPGREGGATLKPAAARPLAVPPCWAARERALMSSPGPWTHMSVFPQSPLGT